MCSCIDNYRVGEEEGQETFHSCCNMCLSIWVQIMTIFWYLRLSRSRGRSSWMSYWWSVLVVN